MLRVCLDEGRFPELASLGFHARDFTGDSRQVYDWIESHQDKYDSYPSSETVAEELGINLPSACDFQLAVDKFKDNLLDAAVESRTKEIVKLMERGDSRGAAQLFHPIEFDSEPMRTFNSGKHERFEAYKDRFTKGISGADIPWPTLANLLVCWENSTLNVLLATANSGKTWLACYVAAETMKLGKKVLLVSMENPLTSIGNRLDSLVFKVPFDDMRIGNADFRIEKRWKDRLSKCDHAGDIVLADQSNVRTSGDVAAIVRAEKPDLVIIDGAYMLDGAKGSRWESSANVVESCQRYAQAGDPPWLCTSQLNPPKNKSATGYEMGYEARGSKEWMIVPSTSILLIQDEDDRMFNRAQIRVAKIREAGDVSDAPQEFYINSNRTTMDFSELTEDATYDIEY